MEEFRNSVKQFIWRACVCEGKSDEM